MFGSGEVGAVGQLGGRAAVQRDYMAVGGGTVDSAMVWLLDCVALGQWDSGIMWQSGGEQGLIWWWNGRIVDVVLEFFPRLPV